MFILNRSLVRSSNLSLKETPDEKKKKTIDKLKKGKKNMIDGGNAALPPGATSYWAFSLASASGSLMLPFSLPEAVCDLGGLS
jgi:hypothetical protein